MKELRLHRPRSDEPVALGHVELQRGDTVTSIGVASGPTIGVGLMSQRFRLLDADGHVVAETFDDTMSVWPQHTIKELRLVAPYTATADEALIVEVYIEAIVTPDLVHGASVR